MKIIKTILKITLAVLAYVFVFFIVAQLLDNFFGWQQKATTDFSLLAIFLASVAGVVLWFLSRPNKAQRAEKLLKHRFDEKQRIIDKVGVHNATLTRDLNRDTNKDNGDEVLKEFFAGISLDMDAVSFAEAKEIALEELKAHKK